MNTGLITTWQIVRHGIDHAQYFQGYGTAFTPYQFCVTGNGDSEYDALEMCLNELFAAHDLSTDMIINDLPQDVITTPNEDIFYYVSVLYNVS